MGAGTKACSPSLPTTGPEPLTGLQEVLGVWREHPLNPLVFNKVCAPMGAGKMVRDSQEPGGQSGTLWLFFLKQSPLAEPWPGWVISGEGAAPSTQLAAAKRHWL